MLVTLIPDVMYAALYCVSCTVFVLVFLNVFAASAIQWSLLALVLRAIYLTD